MCHHLSRKKSRNIHVDTARRNKKRRITRQQKFYEQRHLVSSTHGCKFVSIWKHLVMQDWWYALFCHRHQINRQHLIDTSFTVSGNFPQPEDIFPLFFRALYLNNLPPWRFFLRAVPNPILPRFVWSAVPTLSLFTSLYSLSSNFAVLHSLVVAVPSHSPFFSFLWHVLHSNFGSTWFMTKSIHCWHPCLVPKESISVANNLSVYVLLTIFQLLKLIFFFVLICALITLLGVTNCNP
jgi:hypothetical protein